MQLLCLQIWYCPVSSIYNVQLWRSAKCGQNVYKFPENALWTLVYILLCSLASTLILHYYLLQQACTFHEMLTTHVFVQYMPAKVLQEINIRTQPSQVAEIGWKVWKGIGKYSMSKCSWPILPTWFHLSFYILLIVHLWREF